MNLNYHPRYFFLKELTDRSIPEDDELYCLERLATFPKAISKLECLAASYSTPLVPEDLTSQETQSLTNAIAISQTQHTQWARSLHKLQHHFYLLWCNLSRTNSEIRGPQP